MALISLEIPPGIVRRGTIYQSRGRWYDCDLFRWYEGVPQPVGGFTEHKSGLQATVNAAIRGMLAWIDNNGQPYLLLGTHAKIFSLDLNADGTGTLTDVTPTSPAFTTGTEAEGDHWQFHPWGEDVVCYASSDGRLWTFNTSSPTANLSIISNAPTSNRGVVVTEERFAVALGAGGDPRKVQWADQESLSDWTAGATDQAGDVQLRSSGLLLAGRRGRGETLLWTTDELFSMRYVGGSFIYSFRRLGSDCGAVSSRAMAMVDGRAVWMGYNGFYLYDGFVRKIPCDVGDVLFGPLATSGIGLDRINVNLVAAWHNADWDEVWWFYPSLDGSGECDRYVSWNYKDDLWMIGALDRTDGVDRPATFKPSQGLFQPLCGKSNGDLLRHETGGTWGGSTPYLESGPVELRDGDRFMHVNSIIPDANALSDFDIKLIHANYPTASETTVGAVTAANPTDVRVGARQIRFRVEVNGADASTVRKLGTVRLDVREGERR